MSIFWTVHIVDVYHCITVCSFFNVHKRDLVAHTALARESPDVSRDWAWQLNARRSLPDLKAIRKDGGQRRYVERR